ncbi:MAG: hypothetical protein JXB29_04275 [Sedimentisphaerales bacterium]|nr:hypothetical protein [Sedimentisphaerales bacterium]
MGSPTEDDHTGLYFGDVPDDADFTAGRYAVLLYEQAGGSPDVDDELLASYVLIWTGKGEITADKVLANKAVQNKVTSAIDYYDDDGQTVVLTHTPTDAESTLTRMPS